MFAPRIPPAGGTAGLGQQRHHLGQNGAPSMPLPLIPNIAVFQRKLAGFPIATYQAGETVLTAASTTGRLLILKKGAVAVLRVGPIALLYVATVLARRLDDANQALIELRRQVQAGQPRSVIEKTAEKMEGLLDASGANLVYARYPYDLFAPDTPNR